MESLSHDVWQRKGSCVIFDQRSLAPFIAAGAVVSLHQALSWAKDPPDSPPVTGRTVLVAGLETLLETQPPDKAEAFLVGTIRPLLTSLQDRWTNCGIVFGLTSHPKSFEETPLNEEVLFRRRDRKTVRLSDGLWDGSATVHMRRIIREGAQPGENPVIGYYVARIS